MRKLLLILIVAMVAFAGCGDDGGGDVDVASKKSKADAAKDADAAGDPDFTGKGGKNFCEYLKDLEDNGDELNLSGENNPEQQEKAKRGLGVLEEVKDKAPAEIKADVVVIIEQIKPIFVAIADGKDYKPEAADQPTEAESKELEEAGKRVEAYASNVCGINDEDAPANEQAPADETPPADE